MRAILVFALLSGCTATKAYVVSGESIDLLGQQFIAASNAAQSALAEGRMSNEEFLKWAEFSGRFDTFYGRGVDASKAARAIRDDVAARDIEAAIGRIAIELAGWYNAFKEAGILPKGAP